MIISPVCQWALVVLVLIAAVIDIRTRRIPNWLVLTGMLAGITLNGFAFGWAGIGISLWGGSMAFCIYFVLYLMRGMGAGDVKLMAAIGCLVGPSNWTGILIWTSLLGGCFAVLMVLQRGVLAGTLQNVWFIAGSLLRLRAPYRERPDLDINSPNAIRLPHGATIAAGTVGFLFTPLILRLF